MAARITKPILTKADTAPTLVQRLAAEFLGTFWLVFAGCGAAVLAAGYPTSGSATPGWRWPSV